MGGGFLPSFLFSGFLCEGRYSSSSESEGREGGGERGEEGGGDWRKGYRVGGENRKREVGFDGNGVREKGWSGGVVERGRERWRGEERRDGNEGIVIVEERGRRENRKEGGGKGGVRSRGAEFKNWGVGVCQLWVFLEENQKRTQLK